MQIKNGTAALNLTLQVWKPMHVLKDVMLEEHTLATEDNARGRHAEADVSDHQAMQAAARDLPDLQAVQAAADLSDPQAMQAAGLPNPQATQAAALDLQYPQAMQAADLPDPQAMQAADLLDPQAVQAANLLDPQAMQAAATPSDFDDMQVQDQTLAAEGDVEGTQAIAGLTGRHAMQVQDQTLPAEHGATGMQAAAAALPDSDVMQNLAAAEVSDIMEALQTGLGRDRLLGTAVCTNDDMELCSTSELTELVIEFYQDDV